MAYTEIYANIPTYFAPAAFDAVRKEACGIVYDFEELGKIATLAEEFGNPLPPLQDLAFVYRRAAPRHKIIDTSYMKARPDATYIASSQLELPTTVRPITLPAEQIKARHPAVMQIDVGDEKQSMVHWFATSIAFPPAEDAALKARWGAWGRQFMDAVTLRDAANWDFRKRVISRHSGAIALIPRHGGGITPFN